jgi:hypothetical protein
MENNRRLFFKGLATFASGVVAAKVSAYVPKKEETKEEVLVPSTITVMHEGVQYHPLVVKKTDADKMEVIQPNEPLNLNQYKGTIRKANI